MKKMLDLFSGSKSVSNVFKEYGWEVITLDFNPKLNPDICINILEYDPESEKFDFVWASPDCSPFSVASIGTHWTGGKCAYIPKTEKAKNALLCLEKTIKIINQIKPKNYCIENPRGLMRKMNCIKGLFRNTVWYCQYGDIRAKPTDLFHNILGFYPKVCSNKRLNSKSNSCHHQAARRGSKSGTQGLKNYFERSKIPSKLIEDIILSLD